MRTKFFTAALCVLLFTSCTHTPDSIKSNKHKADIPDGKDKAVSVSADGVWADINSAYDKKYTKFTLPDIAEVDTSVPEEICTFELEYINKNADENAFKEMLENAEKSIGVSLETEPEAASKNITHDDKNTRIKIRGYSAPYCHFAYNTTDNFDNMQDLKFFDVSENKSTETKEAVDTAADFDNKIYSALGDELTAKPCDVFTFKSQNKKYSDIYFQKFYKGMGIQNVIAGSPDGDYNEDGNSVLALMLNDRATVDENNNIYYFSGPDAFTVKNEKKLDNVISFKSACDILENNLADNMNLEFKDIKLWYEPRGKYLSSEDTDPPENIKCTPKWYFISENTIDGYLHTIEYITVDCQNGDIHVLVNGG